MHGYKTIAECKVTQAIILKLGSSYYSRIVPTLNKHLNDADCSTAFRTQNMHAINLKKNILNNICTSAKWSLSVAMATVSAMLTHSGFNMLRFCCLYNSCSELQTTLL